MKNINKVLWLFVLVLTTALIMGCNSNSPTGTGGSGLLGGDGNGGGGGTGNVTFAVALVQDQQSGNLYFEFTPSTAVYITQVRAVCTAIQVDETVPVNDTYDNANPLYIGPVTGTQQGQQWQFTVTGNIGTAQGTAFSVPTNFTVQ